MKLGTVGSTLSTVPLPWKRFLLFLSRYMRELRESDSKETSALREAAEVTHRVLDSERLVLFVRCNRNLGGCRFILDNFPRHLKATPFQKPLKFHNIGNKKGMSSVEIATHKEPGEIGNRS